MMTLLALIDPDVAVRLCATLIHSVWQFALIAVVVLMVQKALLRDAPDRSCGLYVFGLILGICLMPLTFVSLAPPSSTVSIELGDGAPVAVSSAGDGSLPLVAAAKSDVASTGTPMADFATAALAPAETIRQVEATESAPATSGPGQYSRFAIWTAVCYFAGVLLMLVRLLVGFRYAWAIRRRAELITEGRLVDQLRQLTEQWKMRVAPALACSHDVVVPQVVGLLRWTILMPASATTGLTTAELEMILAHELAHIRRHDMWVQLLQRVAESFLFFNPAVWFLSRRISALREYCCDDLTCRTMKDDGSIPVQARYAGALVQVALQSRGQSDSRANAALAGLAADGRSPSELRRRIARLLGQPIREPLAISRTGMFVCAVVVALSWTSSSLWSQVAGPEANPPAEQDSNHKGDTSAERQPAPDPDHPVVTGQILLPDGSPATGIVIMTATDRYGWGEGFTNGNYTKTDENGRYRIVSKRWFPQRLFWLPEDYENNSRAVTGKGGEQKPIRLKPGRTIRGVVTSHGGEPVENVMVRASGAARTPFTWARTDELGKFEFRPLPAGKYFLKPVRSFHEHVTGQLKFHRLPFPFTTVGYELTDDGELPPAKIVAPETVSIRVQVVDVEGKPVTREHVSIGDIADYSNALIAKELQDEPGFYEFQFPKGQYVRDLKLRHSWDQIAYYQEKPGLDPLPADAVVFGKAKQDRDGIKVIVGPSAKLFVKLVDKHGQPFKPETSDFSVSLDHPESLSPSNRPTVAPRSAHLVSAKPPRTHEFRGLVPDCDLTLQVRGSTVNTLRKNLRLSPGEERTIELTVADKTTAHLRGTIVTEDGNPLKKKGWLYSHASRKSAAGTNSWSSTEAHVNDKFSVSVESGSVVLSLFTPGYAPAWIGPLDIKAGEKRDDLKLVLKPGFSFPIHVRDPDGDPIAGATIVAHPEINGETGGPIFELSADNQGNHLYKHAADTRYQFKIAAPGFESLTTEPLKVSAGKTLSITMRPSLITRGFVRSAAGDPIANAKIYLIAQTSAAGKTHSWGGYGYGKVIGNTDERGYFELDQLEEGAQYSMLIEADNRARMLVQEIKAGNDDVQLVMPQRRDLRIKIIGDTNLLPHRRDKPFVGVRQHFKHTPRSGNAVGTDVFVTFTKNGGVAQYQGLMSGTVRVSAGKLNETVDVSEAGVTDVVIRLDESGDKQEDENKEKKKEKRDQAGPVLNGKLTDQEGQPIEGVKVVLYGGVATRFRGQEATTNSKGEYEFKPLKTGAMVLGDDAASYMTGMQFIHDTYVPADGKSWRDIRVEISKETIKQFDLAMTQGGTINGTVIDDETGKPLADLGLRIHNGQRRSNTGTYLKYATTDAQGRFESGTLFPGRYVIDVNDNDFRGKRYPKIGTANVTAGNTSTIKLTSSEDPTLIDSFRITGTAKDADGQPMTYGGIGVHTKTGGKLRTSGGGIDGRGVFHLRFGPVDRVAVSPQSPLGVDEAELVITGHKKGYRLVKRTPAEPLRLTDDPNQAEVENGIRYVHPDRPLKLELIFERDGKLQSEN